MQRSVTICVILLLVALTAYRCFFRLGSAAFQRWDEVTNAAVISDTVSSGSFPILVLNNKPFFEKPPLWYWIQYFIVPASSVTPAHLRALSAVSGFSAILITAATAYTLGGSVSAYTAWILLLTANQLFDINPGGIFSTHTFRSADIDSFLLLLIAISVRIIVRRSGTAGNSVAIGALAGLAVLTKGPISLIVISAYTAVLFFTPSQFKIQRVTIIWVVTCLIALPWYLTMYIRYGNEFIFTHFYYHIATRFVVPLEGHTYPWWYYFGIAVNPQIFPGFMVVVGSSYWILRRRLLRKNMNLQFCFILMCAFILIPTFAQTKLAWYILPFYPFAALITGTAVSDVFRYFSAGRV